jgi:signal transduction histidine kinase
LLGAVSTLVLWHSSSLAWLRYSFLVNPENRESTLALPALTPAALLIISTSIAAALLVERFGARRAFPYLGAGFIAIAFISFITSAFFSLDLLFVPLMLAAGAAGLAAQSQRLWSIDRELTRRLSEAPVKSNSLQTDEASRRLVSGLRLLDTVLSLKEAIVFQGGKNGKLVSSARLRSSSTAPVDPSRNSTWRTGMSLCERALKTGEIVCERIADPDSGTNVALPLRHAKRPVGALLIRLNEDFNEDDRPLLLAVGAQLARNLQREEARNSAAYRGWLDFLSTRAGERRLGSVDALNGLLSEERCGLKALSEIPDGIAMAYLDGTMACVNSRMSQLAHLTEEQAQNSSLFDLLDGLRTDVFDEPAIAVRRVLQTGEAFERELHLSDSSVTLGLRISLVLDQAAAESELNQPVCIVISVRDLTRLKEFEQLKSDTISLMAHELRTPLTSINGFAELLTAEDDLPEQAKEFVTIIANEAQRLSRMINTFLAVTQLERKDKQEVLKIPLRLDDVVHETIVGLQAVAKKKRIRLVVQPTQRLPPVAADKSLISQAVRNLVNNAIKYSPERTTITVSTALEAEVVRVSVEDRGFGIPQEAIDRVWEKFYRVVREGQEKDEESTGLGLSFVREVVEQHGGAVDLESEVGRGSNFSFTLPRL